MFLYFIFISLGLIPSPIIFGSAIQTACLLLQSSCGKTGNCLVYDIVRFRHVLFALTLGFDLLATLAFAVCYFSIRETKQAEVRIVQGALHRIMCRAAFYAVCVCHFNWPIQACQPNVVHRLTTVAITSVKFLKCSLGTYVAAARVAWPTVLSVANDWQAWGQTVRNGQ